MTRFPKWARILGLVLNLLIGALMIFAGAGKVSGSAPPEVAAKVAAYGLSGKLAMIGTGEILSAILLLVPRTLSLGTLLTSGFWGGVICIHMAHGESYVAPSVLLLLTWIGAFLREPRVLGSFFGPQAIQPPPQI